MNRTKWLSIAAVVTFGAFHTARAAPFEVDCSPVDAKVRGISASLQTTESGCGSYLQFRCYSHRLTVAVTVDEALARPDEVGLQVERWKGPHASRLDALLEAKGAGRYERTFVFHTELSPVFSLEVVPYVVAPTVGGSGQRQRCLLAPRDSSAGAFVVNQDSAAPLPESDWAYSARHVEVDAMRQVVLSDGARWLGSTERRAADADVRNEGDRITLELDVDDAVVRELASHDGYERPFALVPMQDGSWQRVDLQYEGTVPGHHPDAPALDTYRHVLVRGGSTAPDNVDLERLHEVGVAFGLEVADPSGVLRSTIWVQPWGRNYRPYPFR